MKSVHLGLPVADGKMTQTDIARRATSCTRNTRGVRSRRVLPRLSMQLQLAELMYEHLQGKLRFRTHPAQPIAKPFASDWLLLVKMVVDPLAEK